MISQTLNYTNLELNSLRLDLGTQTRYLGTPAKQAQYDRAIAHYADLMARDLWRWLDSPPLVFGPIDYLGARIYVPGDGHTRIAAARAAGYDTIYSQVRPGGFVDALRYSLGPANRNYASNKLDTDDLIYRIYLALKDRQIWNWVDRRVLDYCDDGRRIVKLRKVGVVRNQLLEQWHASDPREYAYRVADYEREHNALDIDSGGVEFSTCHLRPKIKRHSTRVNPGDLTKLAHTTAQFRAAQAGIHVDRWIENAILLADRNLGADLLPSDTAVYTYRGDTTCYPIVDANGGATELAATISAGYRLSLVEQIDCATQLLPVRLVGCHWDAGLHLQIALDRLEWIATR